MLALTFLALALLSPSHAMAESHDNSPFACVSPDRPGDDQNEVLWQRFLVEVEAFRECVDQDLQRHQLVAQTIRRGQGWRLRRGKRSSQIL